MAEQKQDQFAGEDSPKVRSHLANERTFLAWVRTGVAMMALGFLVARLRFELGDGSGVATAQEALRAEWVGVIFAAVGVGTVALAIYRYFVVRHQIRNDTYTPSGAFLALLGILVILLGVGIIAFIMGII